MKKLVEISCCFECPGCDDGRMHCWVEGKSLKGVDVQNSFPVWCKKPDVTETKEPPFSPEQPEMKSGGVIDTFTRDQILDRSTGNNGTPNIRR